MGGLGSTVVNGGATWVIPKAIYKVGGVQVCARVGRQVGVASGRDEHRGHGRGGDGERDGESETCSRADLRFYPVSS